MFLKHWRTWVFFKDLEVIVQLIYEKAWFFGERLFIIGAKMYQNIV